MKVFRPHSPSGPVKMAVPSDHVHVRQTLDRAGISRTSRLTSARSRGRKKPPCCASHRNADNAKQDPAAWSGIGVRMMASSSSLAIGVYRAPSAVSHVAPCLNVRFFKFSILMRASTGTALAPGLLKRRFENFALHLDQLEHPLLSRRSAAMNSSVSDTFRSESTTPSSSSRSASPACIPSFVSYGVHCGQ